MRPRLVLVRAFFLQKVGEPSFSVWTMLKRWFDGDVWPSVRLEALLQDRFQLFDVFFHDQQEVDR